MEVCLIKNPILPPSIEGWKRRCRNMKLQSTKSSLTSHLYYNGVCVRLCVCNWFFLQVPELVEGWDLVCKMHLAYRCRKYSKKYHHASCKMHHASYMRTVNTYQPPIGIMHHESFNTYHISCFTYPSSYIIHHASCIMHHASCIMHYALCIIHHA